MGVCLFNWLGYDDKNVLLYLISITNPLFHLLQALYEPIKFYAVHDLYFAVYFINISYWLLVGTIIDFIKKRVR
uniref:Uncharacterized protein n=1 Tax=Anaerobacillus isosaccharinicus TaxID=1532552 RepID=A0A7S7RA88_9BACI|nr:hypothetical protein [Anaerobacillus isosaccharinicus]QOY34669.1 hypothetical protein AWH56_018345 [Anaerobacillus isosaccharinicus]